MDCPEHVSATSTTSHAVPTVFVVDPDPSVQHSLELLISRAGYRRTAVTSAEEFVACASTQGPSCLVSDVSLPGLSGLELQARLANRPDLPIIFIASHFDVSITVRAMKAGAVEFLAKPFSDDALLNAIRTALERSRIVLNREMELRSLRQRYATLSRREREVMTLVASGLLNKQVAGQLGISEITVKAHRGKVMRKMGVASFAQLVALAAELEAAKSSSRIGPYAFWATLAGRQDVVFA